MPSRCSRSHGTPPNCSACVISCSATQRSSWSASALQRLGRVREVRRDEQQPRGLVGLQHAGTRTGRARARRGSRRPRPPRSPARRPPATADGPELAGDPLARRAPAPSPASTRFASIQPGAIDRLGDRHRAGRRRGRCRRRRAARPPPRARASCSNGAGSPAGCRFATPRATVPASFQSITCSRMAGVRPEPRPDAAPRPRASLGRAGGDHRRTRLEVQRRGQRVVDRR